MNKRVLPVFLVASCLAASAAAQTTDSSPPPKDSTDAAKTDAAATAAPAPLVVYFDMGAARSEMRTRPCSIMPLAPTTRASPSS
jgi:hypothetical protein